jgi:hypothetical protein
MSARKIFASFHLSCALLALFFLMPSSVSAGISDFSSYPDGTSFGHTAFTDPHSGITFTDLSGQGLGVDVAGGDSAYPNVIGHFLNSGGFVPGPGWSSLDGFSFSATFPQPAIQSSLAGAYFVPNTPGSNITVKWLDASGSVLNAQTLDPRAGLANPALFSFTSTTPDIQGLTVSGPGISTLWTNISFSTTVASHSVPLPSALPAALATMAALGLAGWIRRRRFRRRAA